MTKTHGLINLKFGGKSRPFKFGWHFLKLFSEAFGIELGSLSGAFTHLTGNQLITFIKIALDEGQRVTGGEDTFTIEQVADWLDEAGAGFFHILMEKSQAALATLSDSNSGATEPKN